MNNLAELREGMCRESYFARESLELIFRFHEISILHL